MANQDHIQLLLGGAQVWNENRAKREFRPDLEGLDVREAFRQRGMVRYESDVLPLAGIDLSSGRLRDTNFYNADLSGATFVSADMRGADLSFCRLQNSNFIGAGGGGGGGGLKVRSYMILFFGT